MRLRQHQRLDRSATRATCPRVPLSRSEAPTEVISRERRLPPAQPAAGAPGVCESPPSRDRAGGHTIRDCKADRSNVVKLHPGGSRPSVLEDADYAAFVSELDARQKGGRR